MDPAIKKIIHETGDITTKMLGGIAKDVGKSQAIVCAQTILAATIDFIYANSPTKKSAEETIRTHVLMARMVRDEDWLAKNPELAKELRKRGISQ